MKWIVMECYFVIMIKGLVMLHALDKKHAAVIWRPQQAAIAVCEIYVF